MIVRCYAVVGGLPLLSIILQIGLQYDLRNRSTIMQVRTLSPLSSSFGSGGGATCDEDAPQFDLPNGQILMASEGGTSRNCGISLSLSRSPPPVDIAYLPSLPSYLPFLHSAGFDYRMGSHVAHT